MRTGQGSTKLTREQFRERWKQRFYDPAFESLTPEIERIIETAWEAYDEYRKSPRKQRAGSEFANPDFELPIEWLKARADVRAAEAHFRDPDLRTRILLICASPRTDETCPGEMSKTFRLTQVVREVVKDADVDLLDLSRLTSEYGRFILPCKACVSTAMPLCHWPCSCYPNHAMGQVSDWMNEIYPRWTAAHGIMIVTPVHWYQAPTVLKSMMDRLVCADGGNPDPTSTNGKDPAKAKELELKGWPYPRHLAGRAFSVVVHGDAEGAESLSRGLHDWLSDLGLVPAGRASVLNRYIGYYEPYATSHDALDRDAALLEEVRNAARSLTEAICQIRAGVQAPDRIVRDPRPK